MGDELPRRPRDPRRGLQLLERRHRQAGRLRHGGAAAGQDRRLRGPEEGRPVEDRREAEREEHHHPPRLVHRSRAHPPRDRRRPRALRGRGLSVRRDQAGDQGRRGRDQARARHLPRHGRPEGQDRRDRLRREQGDRRRQAEPEDEGEQSKRASSASSPAAAPTRKTSSPRTRSSSPTSTATRGTSWPRWASRR